MSSSPFPATSNMLRSSGSFLFFSFIINFSFFFLVIFCSGFYYFLGFYFPFGSEENGGNEIKKK